MVPYPSALQWGHDFAAVEITETHAKKEGEGGLQWGHDFAAVEILEMWIK